MIDGNVKQVVERISHILGNFEVPVRSGGSEAMQMPERFGAQEIPHGRNQQEDPQEVALWPHCEWPGLVW